jgi:hypothetical protein
MNANRQTEGLPQQSLELGRVETVAADNASIDEEYRDVESVAALQYGVAVDIDNIDGREWSRAAKSAQLGQHLVAQLTVVAMDDCQTQGVRGHVSRASV